MRYINDKWEKIAPRIALPNTIRNELHKLFPMHTGGHKTRKVTWVKHIPRYGKTNTNLDARGTCASKSVENFAFGDDGSLYRHIKSSEACTRIERRRTKEWREQSCANFISPFHSCINLNKISTDLHSAEPKIFRQLSVLTVVGTYAEVSGLLSQYLFILGIAITFL